MGDFLPDFVVNLNCRMTTLVECWNKLDGNVGELSSWVNTKVTAAAKYRLSSITLSVRMWR